MITGSRQAGSGIEKIQNHQARDTGWQIPCSINSLSRQCSGFCGRRNEANSISVLQPGLDRSDDDTDFNSKQFDTNKRHPDERVNHNAFVENTVNNFGERRRSNALFNGHGPISLFLNAALSRLISAECPSVRTTCVTSDNLLRALKQSEGKVPRITYSA
jgi:hypothetical protein